jgi:hypothetical protein
MRGEGETAMERGPHRGLECRGVAGRLHGSAIITIGLARDLSRARRNEQCISGEGPWPQWLVQGEGCGGVDQCRFVDACRGGR